MANFFAELKRRHIYRVAAAYTVVAWVLIQLVKNVSPMRYWPEWQIRAPAIRSRIAGKPRAAAYAGNFSGC
jgi:hypothetical protein